MWWDGQNLDQSLVGSGGTRWFFRVWDGTVDFAPRDVHLYVIRTE
jgi:hypothetical protein